MPKKGLSPENSRFQVELATSIFRSLKSIDGLEYVLRAYSQGIHCLCEPCDNAVGIAAPLQMAVSWAESPLICGHSSVCRDQSLSFMQWSATDGRILPHIRHGQGFFAIHFGAVFPLLSMSPLCLRW